MCLPRTVNIIYVERQYVRVCGQVFHFCHGRDCWNWTTDGMMGMVSMVSLVSMMP
jgi:hypothetical protein